MIELMLLALVSLLWFCIGWRARPMWEQWRWEHHAIRAIDHRNHPANTPHATVRILEDDFS